MKLPQYLLLLLLLSFSTVSAEETSSGGGDGCGSFLNPKSFSSYSCPLGAINISNGNTAPTNNNIITTEGNNGGEGDNQEEEKEQTLSHIDFKTGEYTCVVGEGEKTFESKLPSDCQNKLRKAIPPLSQQDKLNSDIKQNLVKFSNRFTEFGIKFDTSAFDSAFDTGSISNQITRVQAKAADSKTGRIHWDDVFKDMTKGDKIDSHTNFETTVSAILAGVFTVDPTFFEDGYVDKAGRVTINESMYFKNVFFSQFNKNDGVFNGIWDWVATLVGAGSSKKEKNKVIMDIKSPVDFMDKQVLGFIVQIAEAFRKAYNEIIVIFFLFGGIYSSSYYAFRKMQEKYGNEPFQINKISFLSTAIMSFVFFAAPIVNDGKVNEPSFRVETSENMTKEEKILQLSNFSSLAQETLRFAVQNGAYYANLTSDYAMHAYLWLIAKKNGFFSINSNDISDLYGELNDLNNRKVILSSQLNFYENVCRPNFYFEKAATFSQDEKIQKKFDMVMKNKEALSSVGIEADRLSYKFCAGLQNEIMRESENIGVASYALKDRLSIYVSLYNTSSESGKAIKGLGNLMVFGQNTFGWIFSPAVPVSYYFFKESDIFLYDKVVDRKENQKLFSRMMDRNTDKYRKIHDIKLTTGSRLENTILTITTNNYINGGFWFLVPGFSSLYDSINGTLQKAYMSDIDLFNKESTDGESAGGLISSFGSLLGKLPFVSYVKGLFGKLVEETSDSTGKKSKYFAMMLSVLAFIVSITIISFVITTVTILVISAYLVLKITMYFIEILMTFLVIPILGIYYTIISKGGGKNYIANFSIHTAMLFVTPILIVFISSLIIPLSELFEQIFAALMNVIYVVIQDGETFLRTTTEASNATGASAGKVEAIGASIQKIFVLTSLAGMTKVFTAFATLLMGIIAITTSKGWFMKLAGLDGAMDSFKEGMSEVKNSAAGKAINPVG